MSLSKEECKKLKKIARRAKQNKATRRELIDGIRLKLKARQPQ